MNINPTELYWREIKNAQPLSRADEVRLFKRARQGDEEARQQIIQANLRFVVSVARNYRGYDMTFGELISEGNVGLLEAVKRFDENRGFKFITYAVWWIRQAILKALAEQSRITRPPRSQINDLQKIDKVASSLSQELGRSPTYNEIATTVDISAQRTHNATEVAQQDLSFDAPTYPDGDATMYATFAADGEDADEEFMGAEMRDTLAGCLGVLEKREYEILRRYFGLEDLEPMTLEEIGGFLGVTRERVRQLRNRALEKLRDSCGEILSEFSTN